MHMNTETALDLAGRRLEPAEAEFWEKHISTCTTCTQDMADWRNLGINLKRSHLENAPPKDLERAFNILTPSVGSKLRQVLAGIIFDSFEQPAFAGARGGATAARQLVLRAEEFDIHVLTLDAGLDPDLFVRRKGKDAYSASLKNSQKYFDYLIERARQQFPVRSAEGKH